MNVISRARLTQFWEKHPNAEPGLRLWSKRLSKERFQNFAELRQVFPSVDQVRNFTIFNIGGNKYRLIAFIDYKSQEVYVRHVLTHAEYDKEDWKNDDWFT